MIRKKVNTLPFSKVLGLAFQSVLTEDSTNVEAIACIGMNHFYSDQPELSLRLGAKALE
jgi:hypothetical protein